MRDMALQYGSWGMRQYSPFMMVQWACPGTYLGWWDYRKTQISPGAGLSPGLKSCVAGIPGKCLLQSVG